MTAKLHDLADGIRREEARRRADYEVVIHALLRRLGVDEVTLTHAEIMAAAEDCERRDVFIVEEHDKILTGTARVYSALRFSKAGGE